MRTRVLWAPPRCSLSVPGLVIRTASPVYDTNIIGSYNISCEVRRVSPCIIMLVNATAKLLLHTHGITSG